MKTALPWVLVAALLAGIYFLYSSNNEKSLALARQSQALEELEKLRAENDELKKVLPENGELDRLRKDHEDLVRLRAEVQRLHEQGKQLNSQLAAAQAETSQAQQAQQKMAQLASENQQLRSQSQQQTQAAEQAQAVAQAQLDVCINNLRQIDGAKQQWGLELKKTGTDVPTAADIAAYLPNPNILVCPGGGAYNINALNAPPTCTVAGHTLAKPQ